MAGAGTLLSRRPTEAGGRGRCAHGLRGRRRRGAGAKARARAEDEERQARRTAASSTARPPAPARGQQPSARLRHCSQRGGAGRGGEGRGGVPTRGRSLSSASSACLPAPNPRPRPRPAGPPASPPLPLSGPWMGQYLPPLPCPGAGFALRGGRRRLFAAGSGGPLGASPATVWGGARPPGAGGRAGSGPCSPEQRVAAPGVGRGGPREVNPASPRPRRR